MQDITYICNLCRYSVNEKDKDITEKITGILFVSVPKEGIDLVHPRSAQNHLCSKCIDFLKEAL